VVVGGLLGCSHMDLEVMQRVEHESCLQVIDAGGEYASSQQLSEKRWRGGTLTEYNLDFVNTVLILNS
jgi:hypothetical protein